MTNVQSSLILLSLLLACGGEVDRAAGTSAAPSVASSASASSRATSTTSTASSTAASSATSSASNAHTAIPPVPATLPEGPTHYGTKTAPEANAACKPLPKGGATYQPLAKAARRLSCEPALFLMTGVALRKELALPADHTIDFSGASTVTIRFPKGKATDLAAAMGVPKAVAARRNAGAWGFRVWDMVTTMPTRSLDLWSPGVINVGVDVEDLELDDKVDSVPLEKSTLDGYLSVTMPEATLPVVDDDVALALLFAGLDKIAAEPRHVSDEPGDAAVFAGLVNERFRVSRRSTGSGPSAIHGIDIWTARTRVAAGPVIAALGLPGKIEHSRAHDADDFHLYDGKTSEFDWRGLRLELTFAKRDTAIDAPHGEWSLSGVTLMPRR